jgi:5,10-methylene-tetrahydrofolate dehydrogenase/methenyl tetrahydrofolate cyclohydrolase
MLGQAVPLTEDFEASNIVQIVHDLNDALSTHGTMVSFPAKIFFSNLNFFWSYSDLFLDYSELC